MSIAEIVRNTHLLENRGEITVALSGGADSVALLLILQELQAEYGFTLAAVHVHHGIRGAEADRDAAFCTSLCKKLDIPFQMVKINVPAYAAEQRISIETAARLLRYAALDEAAPTGFLATAHHAGDQAETLLFHLLRGSGLRGLCGIPQVRGRILRPLLSATKEELLAYLAERGQDFVTDSTNFETDAARNFLRQEAIPLLERCNPQAVPHMARTAMLLSEDEAYLQTQADAAYTACITDDFCAGTAFRGLESYPRPIRMRVYAKAIGGVCDASFQKLREIDDILLAGTGKTTVSGDFYVHMADGVLCFQFAEAANDFSVPLCLPQQSVYQLFPQKTCEVRMLETEPISGANSPRLHNAFTRCTLDSDKIVGNPYFRQWRGSDRITLPGRGFSSSLKTCIQSAVPQIERRRLYALYDDLGCIFCEQVGIAARVKPDAKTTRCLRFFILPNRRDENSCKE